MKRFVLFSLMLFISLTVACQRQIAVDNIKDTPIYSNSDAKYADVFKILDGTWKGNFLIYQDQLIKPKDEINLKDISQKDLQREGLKLINSINVTQVYTSENPYFQRVTITDYYPETKKEEISTGVNKIQDGKMWCIVRKPSETVIHDGITQGDNTIIWSRSEKSPQRIEYFKETVSSKSYEIIGWGYYEGDDPNVSPKLWFYAKYEKQ